MLTYKLEIKNKIDITSLCENYSYMFRKLYANFELSVDKTFQKELRAKYGLDSWIFQSCKVDVEAKLNQQEAFEKNTLEQVKFLEKELCHKEFNEKKGRRNKYYIKKKIKGLKNSFGRAITFGTRELLQKISSLSNTNETESLKVAKKQYQKSRILPISIVGEAPQGSNRKFDFDLTNKSVIFKPNKNTKIPIEFYSSKSWQKQLNKLQQNIGEQPISIRLNNDYLWITFDEEKLSGFAFNKIEYFKELSLIPKQHKQERKDCFKSWIKEQEHRMFSGKIIDRYLSFDLNPQFIGFCILEKINETEFKIIHKECISFENLNTKMRLSSEDLKQVKQNNKRIHELREVWKYIFNVAKHYKAAHCVMEDLDFNGKGINENCKEANRQTKNLWQREKTINLITKYCNTIGMKLIKANACYSTFIGNVKYHYFDPVNSAIEVGRRGITKYLKGLFYPSMGRSDFDTMYSMGLDVQNKTISSWVEAYKLFKTARLRYRRELKDFVETNLLTYKSHVKRYAFYTN